MLHRITDAVAKSDYTVEIDWDDGSNSKVSFGDLVGRGVCKSMQDRDFFVSKMVIADNGYALAWPDEVEFSADSLGTSRTHKMRRKT